jgi:uncharacterized protein
MPKHSALITGASAGLGADLARLFAADGHDLVLVARRRSRLEALARELEVETLVIDCDLGAPDSAERIQREVSERGIAIEYLVNNAGFGSNGAFCELDTQRELDMVAVNIRALVHLTGLFLPAMVERGHGRVLNIGSTAGFQPGPYMATYYASKAFVNHFSEALWFELETTGVSVTVHCPGATATEFASAAGNAKTKLFTSGGVASSAEVAAHAYRAMMAGERMAIHGLKNKVLVQSNRLGPRALVGRIAGRLNRS